MGVQGSQKFAVLLCKFKDDETEPFTADFAQEMICNRGTGGVNDYWIAASLGNINLDGSAVFGWRTLEEKRDEFIADYPGRWNKIQAAVDLFPEVTETDYPFVIAIYNVGMGDAGNSGRGVLLGPADANVTFLSHETGHVIGLDHSYDRSNRKLQSWSQPGEYYDRYDIMSANNVFRARHDRFRWMGPLLNVANLDRMSWLPAARTWVSPTHGRSYVETFDLVSLSAPFIPGFLAARVGDLYLEFRTPEGWDGGIPGEGVLIHYMNVDNSVILESERPDSSASSGIDPTQPLPRQVRWEYRWLPGVVYTPQDDLEYAIKGGTRITVDSIDPSAKTARIRVEHRVTRPYESGPGRVFGGVAAGGDGWLILPDGRRVPVPPRSPVLEVMQKMALAAEAEQLLGEAASQEVTRAVLADAVKSLQGALRKLR